MASKSSKEEYVYNVKCGSKNAEFYPAKLKKTGRNISNSKINGLVRQILSL